MRCADSRGEWSGESHGSVEGTGPQQRPFLLIASWKGLPHDRQGVVALLIDASRSQPTQHGDVAPISLFLRRVRHAHTMFSLSFFICFAICDTPASINTSVFVRPHHDIFYSC